MPIIYLGLGSNLGYREENITSAIQKLKDHGLIVEKVSTIIETDPVGGPPQRKFLNAVLEATTNLSPHKLLSLTQSIEQALGRKKTIRNGPRAIDIDILLYGEEEINTSELKIPHPRMWGRDFVTEPLKEIAPQLIKRIRYAHH